MDLMRKHVIVLYEADSIMEISYYRE